MQKIIYYSFSDIAALAVCIGFTLLSLIIKPINWWCTVLFGILSLFQLGRYLYPKNQLIKAGSKEDKRQSDFNELYHTDGEFLYYDWGFCLNLERNQLEVYWEKIIKIIAYKKDLLTIDEVCLTVIANDNINFTITENTLGWYQFLIHLNQELSIDSDWFPKIAHPAFERNETVIFENLISH